MLRLGSHVLIVLVIAALVGCSPQRGGVTRAPSLSSTESTQPTVTAYPLADTTAQDLDEARRVVVRERPDDDVAVGDLEGDLERYALYFPPDQQWFARYGAKPYKQVLLHKDLAENHLFYVLLKATPESDWAIIYGGIGMGPYTPPSP